MLPALDRKVVRDLLQMKGQVVAIALVMACGVATFVMSMSSQRSLEWTMRAYYDQYRFAEVFAQLKRAPEVLRPRLGAIPGVAHVQTRIVRPVTLDLPDFPEPVVGQLISVSGERPEDLNLLHLRRGRWLDPDRPGEVLVSETFADAHGMQPGDAVQAVMNGRLERLRIVGVVLSPEFIYTIRPGDLVPDEKRFGIFWASDRLMEAAFDMEGAFNDVTLTLEHGASEADVISRMDRLLEPYGSAGAYGRDEQTSHEFLDNEITQLRTMAMIAPSIFLSVAAFLMNVVFSRLVATQREQIATLKALGYSRASLGAHYLKIVVVVGLIGGVLGLGAGIWLGRAMTELYTRFFHFPVYGFHLHYGAAALAIGLSIAAAVLGTARAVWGATRLAPAEAMQPQAPASFRPTVMERLGLGQLLSPAGRMVLRQLERRPGRALLSCLGMAMAVAIMVFGAFMEDAINHVMDHQFRFTQRQDLTVGFVEATEGRVLHDLAHLPGVDYVEPFRSLPARLRAGPTSRRLGIMALPPDSQLFRLLDTEGDAIDLPSEGLVLSDKLSQILGVGPGDFVTLDILEAERPSVRVHVAATVREYTGVTAYMRLDAANRIMRRGRVVSGAFISADAAQMDRLYDQLKRAPRVASVNVKAATLQSFKDTIAENLLVMRTFNVIFACIIAFGVIYNSARIALSERSRELATLRVVGFTRREISMILLGELAVLVAIAIPAGLVLGRLLADLSTHAFDTELFRIPLVIEPSTYGFAAVVALVAAVLSGLVVRRRLDHLDLVAVLKTRE